jgi:hypothetical protein
MFLDAPSPLTFIIMPSVELIAIISVHRLHTLSKSATRVELISLRGRTEKGQMGVCCSFLPDIRYLSSLSS